MSTPADLLAQQQRLNSQASTATPASASPAPSDHTGDTSLNDLSESSDSIVSAAPAAKAVDDSAFPVLGSVPAYSNKSGAKSVWGTASFAQAVDQKPPKLLIRSVNVQESFTIDLDQLVAITKPELVKLLTDLHARFKVNIETTLSQKSNKRTFLISGTNDGNKKARKEIIKRLTKPVSIEFSIPSKLRRIVIGPNGKNLTPIVESTGVKIDIERDLLKEATPVVEDEEDQDEDNFFGSPVSVKIQGDAEGAAKAKSLILAIVDQNTKNVSVKVQIPDQIRPFAKALIESAVQFPESLDVSLPTLDEKSSKIFISGSRSEVLEARDQIKSVFEELAKSIKVETKSIKKSFHSFIDPAVVLEKTGVVITLPKLSDLSSEITFTGKGKDIKNALALVKETTDSCKVLSLDISKAHGGDLNHAKNLAAYLKSSGFFKNLSTDSITVSTYPYLTLVDPSVNNVQIDISCGAGVERSLAEAIRKSTIDRVNLAPPHSIKAVTDIDSFVFSQIDSSIKEVAKQNQVTIVPVATLAGCGNLLLLVAEPVESDFLPTIEEIVARLDAVNAALDSVRAKSKDVVSQVVTVASSEQDLISGSTIRNILSHYTTDGVDIKLHQNAEGTSPNELLIRGFKEEVPKVIEEFQQIIEEVKNYEIAVKYNDTIDYPTKWLSRLIGQKGASVKALSDKYDVKIKVEESEGENSKIVLTGLKTNVDSLASEISSLAKRLSDEKTAVLPIAQKYRGALVGKNGVYIKRLEDKYKVSVNLLNDKDQVSVRGPSKGVAKAEEEIRELLKYEQEHGFKETLKVPSSALSRVFGKGHENINRIASDCGVEVRNNKDLEKEKELGFIEIEVTGTKSGIKEVEKKINEIVANSYRETVKVDPKFHGFLIGPGGSTKNAIISKAGGDGEQNLINIPAADSGKDEIVCIGPKKVVQLVIKQIHELVLEKESEITDSIDVPKKKQSLIIGPMGQTRKTIQSEFNVFIDIPNIKSSSTKVTVKGSAENVEKAKLKIEELTKDNWLVEIMVPASVHSAIAERGYFFRRLKSSLDVSIKHGSLYRTTNKLSDSTIPKPPAEVFGEEDHKWTVVEDEADKPEEEQIPWRLKGEPENVAKAEAIIRKLLEQSTKHNLTGYFYSSKPKMFSKIVGPQARRVQELRERTGCFIVVPRVDDEINNVIYVRGDKEGLEKVKNSFLASLN